MYRSGRSSRAGFRSSGADSAALLCGCDAPGAAAAAAALPSALRQFKPEELLARAMRTVQMTSGSGGHWTPPSDSPTASTTRAIGSASSDPP